MRRRIMIVFTLLILLVYNLINVHAQEDWQTEIKVTLLDAENRLSIGQRPDVAEGWDGRYDVPALLAGDIMAYIEGPEGGKFWRKFQKYCQGNPCTITWNAVVESDLEGQVIKLSWNRSGFPMGSKILLIDMATGQAIDMKTQTEYSFQNVGQRKFQVEIQH